MQVDLCPVYMVDAVWPSLQEGFRRALAKTGGDLSEVDLRVIARTGQGFLFIAYEGQEIYGASLWRACHWATGQKFRCLALFGKNRKLWFDQMWAEVDKVAGGLQIIADGRNGWGRVEPRLRQLRAVYEVRK